MKKLLRLCNLKFIFLFLVAPFHGVSFAQTEVKVILTGYSDDVIADSVLNTLATAVTTAPVDLAPGNVFAVNGYSNTGSLDPLEVGLPTNGQFTSSAGHNFQLADYASNNSLRLLATQSGSLAFDVTACI